MSKIDELMALADEYAATFGDHVTERNTLHAALEAALKDCRNSTLEEAAALCAEAATPATGDVQSDGQFAALCLATQIRSMKS